jgi:Tol biopolymer transport system component
MFYRLKGPKLSKMGQKRPSFFGGRMVTDGEYVAYGVKTEGKVGMVREPSDGSSAVETLTQGPEIAPSPVVDWSPDGRYLSYGRFNIKQGRMENWTKPLQCAPVVGGSQYDGNFSPDGHWLAYFSDETGQPEVYVVPFPGRGGKYQIHMAADGSFAPSRSSLDNSSPASLLAPSP